MFPQPYHSGSTYPLGGIYPLAQPYYRAILSCLLYHTTQPCSQQLQPSIHHTQPSHTTTQELQLSLDNGQAGATPRLTRYLTASQLHAIPTLSLWYIPTPCLSLWQYHSHARHHTAQHTHDTMREPQRHTASHGHGTGTETTREPITTAGTAQAQPIL